MTRTNRLPVLRMASFVDSVTTTCDTTSLVVDHTKTNSVSRFYLLRGPIVLIPSPGITRSRRAGGTLTLIGGGTTLCVGSTTTGRTLLSGTIRAIGRPRALGDLDAGVTGLTFASSTGIVTQRMFGLTSGCEGRGKHWRVGVDLFRQYQECQRRHVNALLPIGERRNEQV